MVKRCADCGFDLAGGRVEVVPTAHYLMGGIVCDPDTRTELPGSTWPVRMPAALTAPTVWAATALRTRPSMAASPATPWPPDRSWGAPARPGQDGPGSRSPAAAIGLSPAAPATSRLREDRRLMDDVGRRRRHAQRPTGCATRHRKARRTAAKRSMILRDRIGGTTAFNLTWHDWLNLESLIETCQRGDRPGGPGPRATPARRPFPGRSSGPGRFGESYFHGGAPVG